MEKKLAAWLFQRHYAESPAQGLRFVKAVNAEKGTEEMADSLLCNIETMDLIGTETPEEDALKVLKEKLRSAERLLAFWEANPKDTNAIFFMKEYNKCNWDEIDDA